jgi:transposase
MTSRKQCKPWNPEQPFLLPPSPLEWLPEGHLAYFLLDVVAELDLSEIEDAIDAKDPRGTQPYDPAMMVALLLYGYCVGVFSSRKVERATFEDVAFRVIAGGQHPHFTRIAAFRREHLGALRSFFIQVLQLCAKAGLVKLGHVAIDGTKVQASASKHKAMSYERMLQTELRLGKEVDALLERADETDATEDVRYGEGCREEDLPAELRRRTERLATIRKAKLELESEAAQARARALREQAARAKERSETHEDPVERKRAATVAKNQLNKARKLDAEGHDDDVEPPMTGDGLPKHEPQAKTDGTPHDKAQMNFVDSESRIMESGGSFVQGYNCQAAVDEEHQIIVGQAVSNKSPDNGNLVPMVAQVKDNCGQAPDKTTADAGYWDPTAPDACAALGTDVYISTRRRKHGESASAVAEAADVEDAGPRQQMRQKLSTDEGRKIYARRKAVVEPVFGQTKEGRGFRRFLLRGMEAVQAEWALVCTGHNLLKLYRSGTPQMA